MSKIIKLTNSLKEVTVSIIRDKHDGGYDVCLNGYTIGLLGNLIEAQDVAEGLAEFFEDYRDKPASESDLQDEGPETIRTSVPEISYGKLPFIQEDSK